MDIKQLIDHVERSFELAEKNESKLTEEILKINGWIGLKTRHFYNNLCNINLNYLEIGTWTGSSFISCLYENPINAIGCDNWTGIEHGSTPILELRDGFFNNTNKYLKNNFKFLDKDCFLIDENDIFSIYDSVDIYLYDGDHKEENHKKSITYFSKMLSKYSIIIVDDWSWETVRRGTFEGIQESNLKIHKKFEKFCENDSQNYWNGIAVFICEK